jgi:pimeloyl-ACP methyl ester carboxylesterase
MDCKTSSATRETCAIRMVERRLGFATHGTADAGSAFRFDSLRVPARSRRTAHDSNTSERAASDFISPQITSKELIEAYVVASLKADPIRADWKQLDEFLALDAVKVKAPTLVIHGERDPFAPIAAQSRLFVALSNADKQWVVLPGADHAAMLEDTHEAFIAAVTGFVERPRLALRRVNRDEGQVR